MKKVSKNEEEIDIFEVQIYDLIYILKKGDFFSIVTENSSAFNKIRKLVYDRDYLDLPGGFDEYIELADPEMIDFIKNQIQIKEEFDWKELAEIQKHDLCEEIRMLELKSIYTSPRDLCQIKTERDHRRDTLDYLTKITTKFDSMVDYEIKPKSKVKTFLERLLPTHK